MGEWHKHGAAAAPLNFKVFGNPQPSNPKENTIWVNTDIKITGWDFAGSAPAEPVEGMIWFIIGVSGLVSFNALKKNGIEIHPNYAKQYVNGTWVNVDAKIYQNGAWVDWKVYLFNQGDDCYSVTGGWEALAYSHLTDYGKAAPTITLEDNCMKISFADASPGSSTSGIYWKRGSVWTKKAIDLTNISTITIEVSAVNGTGSTGTDIVYLGVSQTKVDGFAMAASVPLGSNSVAAVGTYSLDVRDLSGEYYVVLANHNTYSDFWIKTPQIVGQ